MTTYAMQRSSDIHKPELICPKCGQRTIFFSAEMHMNAFFCLSDEPMCNFYADPQLDQFRDQMKQLTGETLKDRDEEAT